MKINLRCGHRGMPQGLAHQEQVFGLTQESASKTMAQQVKVDVLLDPCLFPQPGYISPEPPSAKFLPAIQGGEQGTGW